MEVNLVGVRLKIGLGAFVSQTEKCIGTQGVFKDYSIAFYAEFVVQQFSLILQ